MVASVESPGGLDRDDVRRFLDYADTRPVTRRIGAECARFNAPHGERTAARTTANVPTCVTQRENEWFEQSLGITQKRERGASRTAATKAWQAGEEVKKLLEK